MRHISLAFATAVSIAVSLPTIASAAESIPAGVGVWRGTIGTLPIVACLHNENDKLEGSYYYLKHLTPISIVAEPGARAGATTLVENPEGTTGARDKWSITLAADSLAGTWKGKGKPLPIRLARVLLANNEGQDNPCGSNAFNAPRERPGSTLSIPAKLGGTSYRKLTLDLGKHMGTAIDSFNLIGSSPAIAKVNGQLMDALSAEKTMALECARSAMGTPAMQHFEYGSHAKPVLITRRWAVSETGSSSYCGGAHPNYATGFQTFDLATGSLVDTGEWMSHIMIRLASGEHIEDNQFDPTVAHMLKQAWAIEQANAPDCKDALEAIDPRWMLHPTRSGMAFTPVLPHVAFACTTDLIIGYRELMPFLSSKGRAAVASLQADLKIK